MSRHQFGTAASIRTGAAAYAFTEPKKTAETPFIANNFLANGLDTASVLDEKCTGPSGLIFSSGKNFIAFGLGVGSVCINIIFLFFKIEVIKITFYGLQLSYSLYNLYFTVVKPLCLHL